jgi:16S rRNA A1518/A1519 N6-dimethyltransferase RsmA/KsgA/DIM1 with predicted DNA glycosylase/AP lyase activity
MIFVFAIVGFILLCFSGVLLFGAPYLPTLSKQVTTALTLAELQAGDTLIELGCGDGRVVVAAAKQGIIVIGYELNPVLVIICRLRAWRYRDHVRIVWGNFWRANWPDADAIFVFLLPRYMNRLHKKIMQYARKPVKVVSFAFEITAKKSVATKDGVLRYDYLN